MTSTRTHLVAGMNLSSTRNVKTAGIRITTYEAFTASGHRAFNSVHERNYWTMKVGRKKEGKQKGADALYTGLQ